MLVEYYCDAMLLIARAPACTMYSGRKLHACQYLHSQHHQVPLQVPMQNQYHAAGVHYQYDHGAYDCSIDSMADQSPTRCCK